MRIELDGVRRNQNRYPPRQKMPEHRHDWLQVTLVISGQVTERVGGVEYSAGSLDVAVKPAGVAHENEFGPTGARTLQFELDPQCLDADSFANDQLRTWGWYRNDALTRRFLRLLLNRSSATREIKRLEGLLTALLQCHFVAHRPPPAWIESVRRRVDENYRRPLRVCELAREANVHRVFLARAFRACYGQSITGRLRTLRVSESARLLSETSMPLSAVAQTCGFADQSHLSRVFKSYTGLPPGRFRSLAGLD